MTITEPTLATEARPPRNPVEWRAAETLDVKFPERIVAVRAMPYERETNRVIRQGKQVREIVSVGAFGHCEHRKDVRAYRGHDKERTVGRIIGIAPDDPSGLITEVRMAKTPLGDETLELAHDHLIDVSVGFAPIEQKWSEDRSQRRIVRAYLDHLAFVGDPAYDDAVVLDVRSAARTSLVDRLAAGGTLDEQGLRQLVEYLSAMPVEGDAAPEERQAEPPPAPTTTTPLKDRFLSRLAEVGSGHVTAEEIELRYSRRPT